MEFMTAEQARASSLINRERVFHNIDIAARNCLQEQIRMRVDNGVTRLILSGSSDDASGLPFYWCNPDTKATEIVNGEVMDEFRALRYKMEVKCFPEVPGNPPNGLPGQYDVHLTISWD